MKTSAVLSKDNVAKILDAALDAGARPAAADAHLGAALASCTRAAASSFTRTICYAYGANRGGIDERWFASTTEAANEGRVPARRAELRRSFEGKRFLLARRRRRSRRRADRQGDVRASTERWPVYSKFFDNMGPIPHHMHQSASNAALVGQEGKPESYYFPPQYNNVDNNFCLHVHGPGARHDQGPGPQVPGKLGQGRQRHPRSLAGLSPEAAAPAG